MKADVHMRMVSLIFPSSLALSLFLENKNSMVSNAEVSSRELTFTGMISDNLITEAINVYQARLVKEVYETPEHEV